MHPIPTLSVLEQPEAPQNLRKMLDLTLSGKAESMVVYVPTKLGVPRPTEAINTSDLSEEDLRSLRDADPFMYYSIPAKRRAAMRCEARDRTDSVMAASRVQGPSAVATRKTRITFEMDAVTLMVGDMGVEIEDEDLLDDDDDENDALLFESFKKAPQ